jgi:hypothetical protein
MSDLLKNLSRTIQVKVDQLAADDLLSGERTISVQSVREGSSDQPVCIHFEGDNGKPYKPCKSMRKVLIFAWGDDAYSWIGKSMTLYNKRDVKWGGIEVGGIRISHMSDIASDIKVSLQATKGKKEPYLIKKLDVKQQPQAQAKPQPTLEERIAGMVKAFEPLGVTSAMIVARLGHGIETTTADELTGLMAVYKAVKASGNVSEYFTVETVDDDGVINNSDDEVF